MSRDFDDIRKKIDQSHKELYKQDTEISKNIEDNNKNQEKILSEIKDLKKEIKSIGSKVDIVLEILNNFTIMLAEDDEDLEDNYLEEGESSWIHDQDEDWNSYNDDEDE